MKGDSADLLVVASVFVMGVLVGRLFVPHRSSPTIITPVRDADTKTVTEQITGTVPRGEAPGGLISGMARALRSAFVLRHRDRSGYV